MRKTIEALETLDEYDDSDYGAYLEYTELKDRCMVEPSTMYIDENHEFLSTFKYFAHSDGLEIKVIKGDTRICQSGQNIYLFLYFAGLYWVLLLMKPFKIMLDFFVKVWYIQITKMEDKCLIITQ